MQMLGVLSRLCKIDINKLESMYNEHARCDVNAIFQQSQFRLEQTQCRISPTIVPVLSIWARSRKSIYRFVLQASKHPQAASLYEAIER